MMPTEITQVKLAKPAQRALQSAGIATLEQLAEHSEAEIAALHGIGKNALTSLCDAMREHGLVFAYPGSTHEQFPGEQHVPIL